jgi:3-oxoacyl-[acyl-carrier-protein] synthase II
MGMLHQGLLGRLAVRGQEDPSRACRPFDADHAGTVIGEGGGILILEERRRAVGRRARIYAELAGFGAACDPEGVDYTRPAAGGLAVAIGSALGDAGVVPDQVDLVIAHGSGVPQEDVAEARALRQALGPRGEQVPVVSLTGALGDLFAGAGAVHLATAAMALYRQVAPPTVNCRRVDAACGLRVPAQPVEQELGCVLVAGHGVGGQAAAVVLKRHQP